MAGDLGGRTAIVTGATRGLGRACALALADAGAAVICTGRSADQGEAIAAEIRDKGGRAQFVSHDVGASDQWAAVVDAALSGFERLDIVVNNAGINDPKPMAAMTLDDFRMVMTTNLKGAWLGLKHGVPAIRRHGEGGSIINVSSIMGSAISAPAYTSYSAAKGGMRAMTKAAAVELGPEKIRVNSLHPGLVHSDMTAFLEESAMAPVIPMGRFGVPEEVGAAVCFLAGPRSVFVTGAELVCDGALSIA